MSGAAPTPTRSLAAAASPSGAYGVAAGVVEAQLQNLRTLKEWLMRKIERTVDEGAVRALLRLNDDLNTNLEREETRLVAQVGPRTP